MAYEFKKLSAVEAVETPADTANVLIEENGVIKKTPSGVFTGGGGGGGVNIVTVLDHKWLTINGETCPIEATYMGDEVYVIYNTEWFIKLRDALNGAALIYSITSHKSEDGSAYSSWKLNTDPYDQYGDDLPNQLWADGYLYVTRDV